MKKVVIIGAGIAGLTCGIYAQKNGFETEIYEQHTIPGGECTGWDRGGYHFDGCLHWLVGSKPGTALNGLWHETGALDESVSIIRHDVYTKYVEGDREIIFYTDVDRLERHFLEIAPEDRKEIKKLCALLRGMGDFGMPLDKPMDLMTGSDGLRFMWKNLGNLPKLAKLGKLSMEELVAGFRNPMLKRALLSSFPAHYAAMAFLSTLAGMNAGDCGFPQGGSRALARRMERKFLTLGGKVFYRARTERVLVEGGRAVGILLTDGREVRADHVVSCADAFHTFTDMLGDRYTPELYRNLFAAPKQYRTVTSALVFLGVDAEVPFRGRSIERRRETPYTAGGILSDSTMVLHYGFDRTMLPAGKTVLSCYYLADYDHWKALSADRERYLAEKEKLLQDAIAEVEKIYPEIAGHVEVTDVVTPVTYERYCGAWRGSWMTWVKRAEGVPQYYPGVLPGLENFILAGMWTMPPGGLPGAAASGRFAAQRLCVQNGIPFRTE